MKHTTLFSLLLALICSLSSFAQVGFENYILFDADCMKQYDYIRSSNYHDVPFWDFHFKVSPHQSYVFRVLKQDAYQEEISKLDKKPINCQNSRSLDNQFITEINSNKKTAYIVLYDAKKKMYNLLQVKKVIQYSETPYALSYKDHQRFFVYNSNDITQGKNLDTTNLSRVLFEGSSKLGCAKQRKFRSFDKVNPRLSENLYFVENIGLAKIESTNGTLDLHSINGELLGAYIQRTCSTKIKDTPSPNILSNINPVKNDTAIVSNIESELPNPFGTQKTNPTTNTSNIKSSNLQNATLDSQGFYTVQEGDNLYKIATKFNTSVAAIKATNNLNSNVIDRNQRLKIKSEIPYKDKNPIYKLDNSTGIRTKVHVVNQGECLWDIAKRYNTNLKNIIELNALTSESIDIQQEIIIEKIRVNK